MKGYLIVVETKLLQLVNETLCSVPKDGANCCYLDHLTSRASATQCQPIKRAIRQAWVDRLFDD